MITFFKVWTEGIIVSIIIATIIEILLPDNSNKKYIRMIIGIYILFTIINPILNKFSAGIDLENIMTSTTNVIEIEENITDTTLTDVFINNVKTNIQNRLKLLGYNTQIEKLEVDDELTKITYIEIDLTEEKTENRITNIQNVEINVRENNEVIDEKIEEDTISEIKKILTQEYGIEKILIK